MLEQSQERSPAEAVEDPETTVEITYSSTVSRSTPFRLGRLVYGGILAFMAIDGLRNSEGRVQFAKSKGVPMPKAANTAAHALLLGGGAGIALWRAPKAAATAIIAFFAGVTPMMHDFWAMDDPEEKQRQTTNFLKNAALLGTAVAILGIALAEE